MQRPGDDYILELLAESGLILSPAIIAVNIEYSREYVTERLAALLEHDMIEKVDEEKGYYRIAEMGQSYLSGELDPEDFD